MRLFIAEKPSLARAIAEGLDGSVERDRSGSALLVGDNVVSWCYGHLLELASPQEYDPKWAKWHITLLPITVERWKLLPKPDGEQQLQALGGWISRAKLVVNAGDPDREGQLLVDEVLEHFNWQGPTQRILLNATDLGSVRRALAKIEDNTKYRPLKEAAQCRQRADWLVGMNLTRACTRALSDSALVSVGRVQTPTLALVVRRDRAIANFVVQNFYNIVARVQTAQSELDLLHEPDPRLTSKNHAQEIANTVINRSVRLSVQKKDARQYSPLPFHLADFQKAAEDAFGWGANKSLQVLQKLYEGKLTSYPRTDCRYLPADQSGEAMRIAQALAPLVEVPGKAQRADSLLSLMAPKKHVYDSGKVAEHHGLVPTGKVPPGGLDKDLRDGFGLVLTRFLKSLLPHFEYEETVVSFVHDGYKFGAKGQQAKNMDQSWRVLEPKDGTLLPPFDDGAAAQVINAKLKPGKTTAPKPYTEASLIEDMRSVAKYVEDERLKAMLKETAGIGTAATQASIIETLKAREFVRLERKTIRSTELGQQVIDAIPAQLADPGITARWEEALDRVAGASFSPGEFMERINVFVQRRIEDVRKLSASGSCRVTAAQRDRSDTKNTTARTQQAKKPVGRESRTRR